jgi:AcrR family transcriptional regulator
MPGVNPEPSAGGRSSELPAGGHSTELPAGGRTYGRQSSGERAADRRDTLLDAAFVLVAASGWPALRIDALCRAAGLNKRYFYESFADLEAVIAALVDRVAAEAIAVAVAAIEPGADLTEATRRSITAFVHHLTDDPRRARVLFGALPADDAAAGHRTDAIRRVVAAAALTGRGINALPEDPTVTLTAAMLVGGTSQVILDWLDGQIDCGQERLIADLVMLWQAAGDAAVARVEGRPPLS